jgi:hypothetical protein
VAGAAVWASAWDRTHRGARMFAAIRPVGPCAFDTHDATVPGGTSNAG